MGGFPPRTVWAAFPFGQCGWLSPWGSVGGFVFGAVWVSFPKEASFESHSPQHVMFPAEGQRTHTHTRHDKPRNIMRSVVCTKHWLLPRLTDLMYSASLPSVGECLVMVSSSLCTHTSPFSRDLYTHHRSVEIGNKTTVSAHTHITIQKRQETRQQSIHRNITVQ